MNIPDYYGILGVRKSASEAEIKAAYRQLAMLHHPDRNEGNTESTEIFKAINEAYAILSDKTKRESYDRLFCDVQSESPMRQLDAFDSFSFSDIGQERKSNGSSDFYSPGENVSFDNNDRQYANSWDKSNGTGDFTGEGSLDAHTDFNVSVSDIFRTETKTFVFSYKTGRKTHKREIKFAIPPGLHDGSVIKVAGQGIHSADRKGDLYVKIHIVPDDTFRINNDILEVKVNVLPWDAVLGGTISVPLPEGSIKAVLPPLSPAGRKLKIHGMGLPLKNGRGDICAIINIAMPEHLSEEQIDLLRRLKEISS